MNLIKAGILMLFAVGVCIAAWSPDSPNRETHFASRANQNDRIGSGSRVSMPADNPVTIHLIQPDSASQVTTFAPTFSWHPIKTGAPIQYRLLLATIDGRVIFDEWIGSDTSYTLALPNKIKDLHAYYWSVRAAAGDRVAQSPVWSFWVDQDKMTDLTISNLTLKQERRRWKPGDEVNISVTVQNSGPTETGSCYVTLFSGDINRNYFSYAAHRKTVALDTVFIPALLANEPQSVTLSARLPYGFNHLFVRVDPAPGLKDVIYSNNFISGITIQTEPRQLLLKSLFMIYSNYFDPETGEKRLNSRDRDSLHQNILNLQRYFWDHTHIIQMQADTLHIDRLLTDKDFIFQNHQQGYYLSPDKVNQDLVQHYISEQDYDLVFVYYSWWNSRASWSGYLGYTFRNVRLLQQKVPFLAQPITMGQVENETTAIHEMLHLFDNLYEHQGEKRFYSPHFRLLYTTFEKNEDFFDWILETWPTARWFDLKMGRIVQQPLAPWFSEPADLAVVPKTLILSQNDPNPFDHLTAIIYRIPRLYSPGSDRRVKLVIYNLLGNPVRTLVDQAQNPGTHQVYWDGKDHHGEPVASGIYFYELTANQQRQVKKLLYIR